MGKLYIVGTPIGNLEDITLRALRVLKEVDLVLCEDTRQTRKLLDHYRIKTPTQSFHQHSNIQKVDWIIKQLAEGKNLALVTDAGTPGVSDPGGVLVKEVLRQGYKVEAVPGASSLTAAISVAGIPLDKFVFLGFLPHKKGRQTLLKQIESGEYPVILYESVHRIGKLLEELAGKNYYLIVARELTKKFETVYRGTIEEIKAKMKQEEVKGEFVVIIKGNRIYTKNEI